MQLGSVKVLIVPNYHSMSEWVAREIATRVREIPHLRLGLATGSTPEGVYQHLIQIYYRTGVSFRHCVTFNLDEYVGLAPDHPQSYRSYMTNRLFDKLDLTMSQTYLPLGNSYDLMDECDRYEQLIQSYGGIDLQILGIGLNGHIGFNEPGTSWDSDTHVVRLTSSTRMANLRFFHTLSDVPTHAITMGIGTILRSKQIYLLAAGEKKAEVVRRLLLEEPCIKLPASALHHHPDATLIVDQAAISKVKW